MIRQHSVISRPGAHRRAGFTLVEILVVIAIIGILAAILFPVFRSAREAAKRSACASNLKQLGIAFQLYTKDYADRYPFPGNFQGWKAPTASWVSGECNSTPPDDSCALAKLGDSSLTGKTALIDVGGISNYTKNTEIYMCPSAEFGEEKRLSYSMNCALGGINSGRVKAPSSIVLLVDEGNSLNDGFFFATDTTALNGASGTAGSSSDAATEEHGGANLLFADGHVKSITPDAFPLDTSQMGMYNKGKLTGDIRFHDVAFGSSSGNSTAGLINETGLATSLDSCAQPATAKPPTKPPGGATATPTPGP